MPVGLKKKIGNLRTRGLLLHHYIEEIQYTEKLDAIGLLHPCMVGSLRPRCPSGHLGHLGMPVGLKNKMVI
jgi:hypothetical protein